MTDLITPKIIRAAGDLAKARANLKLAMAQAEKVGLAMLADDWTEVAVGKALGVNRMTVRKWAGKL